MQAKPSKSLIPAVLITSDLTILCRHPLVVEEILSRGLAPVVVFGPQTDAAELADYRNDSGKPLAGIHHIAHVADYHTNTLLEVLLRLQSEFDFKALLNCGELFVESAGLVAESLGLPGPGTRTALTCRNKLLQRISAPDLAPAWSTLSLDNVAQAVARTGFPAIIKPTGRMSSSGVLRVDDEPTLRRALAGYQADEVLLLEACVEGPEFSIESLVHEGQVVWSGITAKRTNEGDTPFFTETGHTSPAPGLATADEQALIEANAYLLRQIGFRSGMAHAEFRLGRDGRAVLMEIAARPPGDAIMMMWHLACGQSLEPALVALALGESPQLSKPRRRTCQHYMEHPHGILQDVQVEGLVPAWIISDVAWPERLPVAADAPARCCAVLVSRRRGDLLGKQSESGQRSVSLVVDGPLEDDLDGLVRHWSQAIEIVTAHPVPVS
ncbi:ATP-grasp domain-containing protein [Pseudomonas carassii]|uniref:ATP-grasp domain-containing protein n=1 Tax=Pseudomonas carassii TaxID=3115855 RepID=A0ABU7HGU2_9PSED|nr:ATP-grasp domain-containing protein [Pseudomonas sp. 137P]MEE1890350.1 ATP-grasp domain-containing protein [Pseudomonas sp. 137P]